jgi:hypothetical protein
MALKALAVAAGRPRELFAEAKSFPVRPPLGFDCARMASTAPLRNERAGKSIPDILVYAENGTICASLSKSGAVRP